MCSFKSKKHQNIIHFSLLERLLPVPFICLAAGDVEQRIPVKSAWMFAADPGVSLRFPNVFPMTRSTFLKEIRHMYPGYFIRILMQNQVQ